MKFARRWFIAAACMLGLLAGTGVAQAQSTKLLPPDTEMVVTFNLQQILKSDVVKENKLLVDLAKDKINDALDSKDLSKWLKKSDFDLYKNLSSITFAIPGARNPEEGFILLEGDFDADKIEAAALEAGKGGGALKVIMLGGVKAFEVSPDGEKTIYVGVINKKTMIACSTKDDFKGAVARSKSDKPAQFKSAVFNGLMQTVKKSQSVSFVATSNAMLKLADKAPDGAQVQKGIDILKQLDGFSAAVTVQKNIDFQLGVNTKDKETASDYAAKGNLGLGLAKLKLAENKDDPKMKQALDIVNSIRISSQGPNLVVSGQITFETLDKLLKMIPMQ